MYIIAGLGNPGKEYVYTRHNTGFLVIDALAEKYGIEVAERSHKAFLGRGMIEGHKVILVKPQTYMNLSGESIRSVTDYYKIDPEQELIVIYDDISLNTGLIRIREKGSAGGHNGIKSIISHLGTQVFRRIKVGVGDRDRNRMELADHVLGRFGTDEKKHMAEAIDKAVAATVLLLEERVEEAMNTYNRKSEDRPESSAGSGKEDSALKAGNMKSSTGGKADDRPGSGKADGSTGGKADDRPEVDG